jgi:uncharacterized peroxidase-related enzyme
MTARIKPIEKPSIQAQAMLESIQAKLGKTPNIFKTFAHSPAVLESYLNFSGALAKTKLSAGLREQIALAVAGANQCDYCASAHTAIGKSIKVDEADLARNLQAKSNNPKVEAALQFAQKIVKERGHLSDHDLSMLHKSGYTDEEVVEIIAVVCLNIFTNYFNHIAGTVVDFPLVSTKSNN